jgi:hypothetical protein
MPNTLFISIQNVRTGQSRYFMTFDTLGNVVTTPSLVLAFDFGVDINSAQFTKARVIREFEFIGDDKDFEVTIVDF